MNLHGSLDEQSVLVTAVVVVVNIVFNRGNELFSACKSTPIIALTLQDSPEAFFPHVVPLPSDNEAAVWSGSAISPLQLL